MPCVKDFTAQVYTKIFTPRLVRRVRARGEHKRRYLLCAVLLGRGSEWPMPVVTSKGRNRKRSGSRKISNLERERERERGRERERRDTGGSLQLFANASAEQLCMLALRHGQRPSQQWDLLTLGLTTPKSRGRNSEGKALRSTGCATGHARP